jgi:dihydrofolate synthase/folylpolyglutamate synthase
MKYEDAVNWVDGFHQFGIQLGLNRIEKVLDSLDNPHKKIDFVHVAGTNGKGSVCRYISSILSSEGYKTGLYLSPHLVDFRERFLLDNKYISKQRFVDIVTQIKPVVEQMIAEGVQLTYFEVCTVIAFVFFADENVDYAIIEVGLGGRYDATNVITPLVSVITNVSLDHQQQLGETITAIAGEKAGIIKPNIPVVTAAEKEALMAIRKTCEQQHAGLTVVTNKNIVTQESLFTHQTFLYHGFFNNYTVTTQLIGMYQSINVALSIAVIEVLQQQGVFVTKESICKGIKEMNHPGRMQLLKKNPFVLVDGAHNADAMKVSVDSLKKLKKMFSSKRVIVIFGVMNDKNIRGILKILLPITDTIIVTRPKQKRAASIEEITHVISTLDSSKQVIETETVYDAYEKAIELAKEKDIIFGSGSLFTVGELIQIFNKK